MGNTDKFADLGMSQLISSPVETECESKVTLAQSTADFINEVGFDENGKARTVSFQYEKPIINQAQKIDIETVKLDVPMLSIVPIPNLQVDEVNVVFDMEVHKSVGSEERTVASVVGINEPSGFKVNISGAVSQNKKSDSDDLQDIKYHVHVNTKNDQIPEDMAQILEIMSDKIDMKEK